MKYLCAQWLSTWQGWKYSCVPARETGSSAQLLPCREHAVVLTVQLVLNDLVVRPKLAAHHLWHYLLGNAISKRSQVLLPDTETKQSARTECSREDTAHELLQHTGEASSSDKFHITPSSATRGISEDSISVTWNSHYSETQRSKLCSLRIYVLFAWTENPAQAKSTLSAVVIIPENTLHTLAGCG